MIFILKKLENNPSKNTGEYLRKIRIKKYILDYLEKRVIKI